MNLPRHTFGLSFLYALLLHVLIIALMLFSFDIPTKTPLNAQSKTSQPNTVIQAVSVSQIQVDQEVARLQTEQQNRAAQAKVQQQKLNQQKADLQKQQERAAKALAALQAEQQSMLKQKAQLEKLQQQEAKIQAAQKQATAQQELQQKLAAEQEMLATAREKQMNSVVSKYNTLILNAIYPNWIVTDKQRGLSTDLGISLAKDGTVLSVVIQKSSGVPAFDNSAVAAVYKSSPLPVPNDPQAFAVFRSFKLTLKPENIKAG